MQYPRLRRLGLLTAIVLVVTLGLSSAPASATTTDGAKISTALNAVGQIGSTVANSAAVSVGSVTFNGGVHKQLRRLGDGGIQALAVTTSNRLVAVDGGVLVLDTAGNTVNQLDEAWAIDSTNKLVTTSYTVSGNTLLQHVGQGVGSIVADPTAHLCDWWTHLCVKFGRTATHRLAGVALLGVGAWAGVFCGLIPSTGYLIFVKAGCAALVVVYFYQLRNTFINANKAGRCVELKYLVAALITFGGIGVLPVSWKQVTC
jgi:hypothetical protein